MAFKITWAPQAVSNLEDICDYISKDSEYYAALFVKKVIGIIKRIPEFPMSGRVVPEYSDDNIRERIYGDYRIVYRIKGDKEDFGTFINKLFDKQGFIDVAIISCYYVFEIGYSDR